MSHMADLVDRCATELLLAYRLVAKLQRGDGATAEEIRTASSHVRNANSAIQNVENIIIGQKPESIGKP